MSKPQDEDNRVSLIIIAVAIVALAIFTQFWGCAMCLELSKIANKMP
jgi:uncharacterized protein YoxC